MLTKFIAARRIQRGFRDAYCNPDYKMCRDRLLREFSDWQCDGGYGYVDIKPEPMLMPEPKHKDQITQTMTEPVVERKDQSTETLSMYNKIVAGFQMIRRWIGL